MPARWEPPTLDHGYLVRHVCMNGIVRALLPALFGDSC